MAYCFTHLKRIISTLLLLYTAYCITKIFSPGIYQWDFRTYYYAAKTFLSGLNPYDIDNLSTIAQKEITLKFLYPPITLYFFSFFTIFEYNIAYYLFLLLKLLLVFFLIYLWKRYFFNNDVDIFFYLLCLFAFNATLYLDIRAGNISILEQFFLWLGFYFLIKEKYLSFCFFIVLASIFKLQPIIFLLLLLFTNYKKRYLLLLNSTIFILCLTYFSNPSLFISFLNNSITVDERGIINPSTFALIRDIYKGFVGVNFLSIELFIYFIIVVSIINISYKYFKKIENKKIVVFFSCVVFALISPRFKDYSYILLIPPTYFIIKNTSIKAYPILILLIILSSKYITLPFYGLFLEKLIWRYYPLVLAYLIWFLYLNEIIKNLPSFQQCIKKNQTNSHL